MENKIPLFPEDDGYFDDIKTAEIIESYDGPKIFTFLTQSEDYYLAWFGDDLEDGTLWMIFPVNNYLLDKLLKDRISIRDFFRLARFCHLTERDRNGKVRKCESCTFDKIPDDLIPDEDVFLENQKPYLNITMVKEGLSPLTVKENALITVISYFRKAVKSVMKIIKKENAGFESFPAEPNLSVSGILHGSVRLTLKPIDYNPLLAESLRTIQKVVSAGEGADTGLADNALTRKVKKTVFPLLPNPKSRLLNFDSLQISGNLMGQTDGIPVSFELSGKHRKEYQSLIREEEKGIRTVVLVGEIREYDRDNDIFTLRNIQENAYSIREILCNFDPQDLTIRGASEDDILTYFNESLTVEITGRYSEKEKTVEVNSIRTE